MKCLNCQKYPAQIVPVFGVQPCKRCTKRSKQFRISETIEITTSEIKEERKVYAQDILQRQRGSTPSLEYIKRYGTKGFTKEQVKEARNVWGSYYEDKTERAIT